MSGRRLYSVLLYDITIPHSVLTPVPIINKDGKQGPPYDIRIQKQIRNRDAKSVYQQTAPSCYSIQLMLHKKHQMIAYFTPARYLTPVVSQLILFDRCLTLVAQQLMLFDRQTSYVLAILIPASRCPAACSTPALTATASPVRQGKVISGSDSASRYPATCPTPTLTGTASPVVQASVAS